MQMTPGEHSVLAYFPSWHKAEKAVAELKQIGIDQVRIDRVSRYGFDADSHYNNPIAGQAETVTGLTLYSRGTDSLSNQDTRVLLAADPSVSGYGNKDYGTGGRRSVLVTAVTGNQQINQAVRILEEHGGMV